MKLFAYVVAVIVVLAALFHFFKPAESTPSNAVITAPVAHEPMASAPAAVARAATPEPAQAGEATRIDLVYAKGRLVSGPTVVKVKQNDRVSLNITSDTADELHLHGINLHLQLKPGQIATLDFVATKTGRFTYELHHADVELGAIEVYPR